MATGFTERATGALSGLRDRLSGGSRNADRYADEYDDYGYDDYADYGDYPDYGEYSYDAGDPYDDIDDARDVGEVRTRRAASNPRNHPPLLSFEEARVNTYVPDRLMRDPLEHTASRSSSYRSGYQPRRRDAVNVGHAAEYDFASVGGAQLDEQGVEVPPASPVAQAAARPHAASGASAGTQAASAYDPYASFQGAGAASHVPTRKLKVLSPAGYGEVESIARALKAGDVVVLDLANTAADLAKRILDFSFGVASALDASVDCAADKVFVVCRGQGLSDTERAELQSQGVIR